jgi:hypothetical protein
MPRCALVGCIFIQYDIGMRFRVVPTHYRGIPRPKREIARADGVVGDLITCNRPDDLLRRTTLVASLIDPKGGAKASELLPPLYDATLVLIAPGGMMFRGCERIDLDDAQIAEMVQGWWVRAV